MRSKQNLPWGSISVATVLCAAAASTQGAKSAAAECPFSWKPGDGLPGLDGLAYAMTTWDPDGPGPQAELLLVGGEFTAAGDGFANNIAAWDGTSWSALASGTNGPVRALTLYNGELIAGGLFTTAGGVSANRIAKWNGTSWSPLGSGMSSRVLALTVYNGELIAGGDFFTAGGAIANNIAKWDGVSWSPLGNGMDREVYVMTTWDPDGPEPQPELLMVGGEFTVTGDVIANNIAAWDGTSWSALGSGTTHAVLALTEYNGDLIAGGDFTAAGEVSANRIAKWDGSSWSPLGGGMNSSVEALTVYNGDLVAGDSSSSRAMCRRSSSPRGTAPPGHRWGAV